MKKFLSFSFSLLTLLFFFSCNKVPQFTVIQVTDNADVTIAIGDEMKVVPINSQDEAEFVIEDGALKIYGNSDATLYLPESFLTFITAITVDSNASLESSQNLVLDFPKVFALSVNDNGDLFLNINVPNLYVNISGNGTVELEGENVNTVTLNAQDNADYYAFDLFAEDYTLNVTGTAGAVINASNSIIGHIKNSAVVYYLGNPQNINVIVEDNASFINVTKQQ